MAGGLQVNQIGLVARLRTVSRPVSGSVVASGGQLRHHDRMDVEELVARHPRAFHTMSAAAWPSVQRHGLLSTRQLVDLFELEATDRDRLLGLPQRQVAVRNR
jgi:hypothetical protein